MPQLNLKCIRCHRRPIIQDGENLQCTKCNHKWTVKDEQLNARYIGAALGRPLITVPHDLPLPEKQGGGVLLDVVGIGAGYVKTLAEHDIHTLPELIEADPYVVETWFARVDIDEVFDWIKQAEQLING